MALETRIGVLLVPYDLNIVDWNSRNKMIIMALEVHHTRVHKQGIRGLGGVAQDLKSNK